MFCDITRDLEVNQIKREMQCCLCGVHAPNIPDLLFLEQIFGQEAFFHLKMQRNSGKKTFFVVSS